MTDEQLVADCRNGNSKAWEELYLKYKPRVRAVANCFYLYGYCDNDDLIQEGMSGLLSAVISFKDGNFSAYATICIKNRILDAVRRSANRIPVGQLSEYYPSGEDTERSLIDKEDYAEFFKLLEKQLSSLEYSVMQLYLEGFSSAEICEKLSLTYKSVDNALNRAKNKIKSLRIQRKGE